MLIFYEECQIVKVNEINTKGKIIMGGKPGYTAD